MESSQLTRSIQWCGLFLPAATLLFFSEFFASFFQSKPWGLLPNQFFMFPFENPPSEPPWKSVSDLGFSELRTSGPTQGPFKHSCLIFFRFSFFFLITQKKKKSSNDHRKRQHPSLSPPPTAVDIEVKVWFFNHRLSRFSFCFHCVFMPRSTLSSRFSNQTFFLFNFHIQLIRARFLLQRFDLFCQANKSLNVSSTSPLFNFFPSPVKFSAVFWSSIQLSPSFFSSEEQSLHFVFCSSPSFLLKMIFDLWDWDVRTGSSFSKKRADHKKQKVKFDHNWSSCLDRHSKIIWALLLYIHNSSCLFHDFQVISKLAECPNVTFRHLAFLILNGRHGSSHLAFICLDSHFLASRMSYRFILKHQLHNSMFRARNEWTWHWFFFRSQRGACI